MMAIHCELCGCEMHNCTIAKKYCKECREILSNFHALNLYRRRAENDVLTFDEYCDYQLRKEKRIEQIKRIKNNR